MNEIYQAPLYKRIFAGLLDFIVTILLALGIFMLLVNGAVDIGFHNLDYKLEQYSLQDQSHLFDVTKEGDTFKEIKLYEYDEGDPEEYKAVIKRIHDYYFDYVDETEKSEEIFNKKYMFFDETSLENSIFKISSLDENYSTYILKDDVLDVSSNKIVNISSTEEYKTAIKNFFMDESKGAYSFALTDFTKSEKFLSVANRLEDIEKTEALICVSFSSLIFISLPILFNKNGETAFMHIFGLCFSDSYGYKIKWRHKIIRAILNVLLYASSTFLLAIPIATNAIVCLATSQKRSILDFASEEVAVDRKTSVILEN